MTLISQFWLAVRSLTTWLTFSPVAEFGLNTLQLPLGVQHDLPDLQIHNGQQSKDPNDNDDYPVFRPPAAGPDKEFECNYAAMTGWFPCSIPENRECWLRNKDGSEFNIHTNYEKFAPTGITRHFHLNITETSYNGDGMPFDSAKLFNGTYPGPWIEACWGDTLNITVTNNMKSEGTSIHWHGIRQNQTMAMDGVNGITQCPIAPGDSFTYSFKATQYGTSWYHSHYSVQYADGLQGPLTIHGPTSAPFDASKRPLIMTDWSHLSAHQLLTKPKEGFNGNKTILLNGKGNVTHFGYKPSLDIPDNYNISFEEVPSHRPKRPKRYLLRLINTSFDSTFVFSIDNHWLQVVSADFVPIEPYFNTSILVGIGQRYNVIVEANPLGGAANPIPDDRNFWIRTWVAQGCGLRDLGKVNNGYERTGILRYDNTSRAVPTSQPWTAISKKCSDETYTSLRPKVPWYIGEAANALGQGRYGQEFNVTYNTTAGPTWKHYPVARFSIQPRPSLPGDFTPLQINYSDPMIMHLGETKDKWPAQWVVIPENYTEDDWVYLVLTMDNVSNGTGAHPMHLHGHDFAILLQVEGQHYNPRVEYNLTLDNPPRRDVVLLPRGGFVIIAFKADNPGSWLMHCHIARHASEGLALQILERQSDVNQLYPPNSPDMIAATQVCDRWKDWRRNNTDLFEGDSGI